MVPAAAKRNGSGREEKKSFYERGLRRAETPLAGISRLFLFSAADAGRVQGGADLKSRRVGMTLPDSALTALSDFMGGKRTGWLEAPGYWRSDRSPSSDSVNPGIRARCRKWRSRLAKMFAIGCEWPKTARGNGQEDPLDAIRRGLRG